MAIINNAHSGSQINLICLIISTLYSKQQKITKEELFELCRPKNLLWTEESEKRFQREFNFWKDNEVVLWKENEEGKIILTGDLGTSSDIKSISKYVHDKLFKDIDEGFLSPDNKVYSGLFRVLSFVSLIDNFHLFSEQKLSKSSLDEVLSLHFNEFLLNDSEKSTFIEWGNFLGYFQLIETSGSSRNYIVDPTNVLSAQLKTISEDKTEFHIKEFLTMIGENLPVLGFGHYSLKTREYLGDVLDSELLTRKIPFCLSVAIQRLAYLGKISLSTESDDKNVMALQLFNSEELISKVKINQGGL